MTISLIVIHCSQSPNGREDTAFAVHRWHQEKGWAGVGYHYIIERNGKVANGRPEYWEGAHVRGHNAGSLGICLIGTDEFTAQQWESLHQLVSKLAFKYQDAEIVGHYELDPKKTCPNFSVPDWVRDNLPMRR